MENNIIENNLLIARFMGGKLTNEAIFPVKKDEIWLPYHGVCKYNVWGYGKGKTLNYQCDWGWLMAVVIKINIIEDYRFTVQIDSMDTTIHDLKNGGFIFKSECKWQPDELINSVYEAVVFFINWYNSNIQNNETN